ncbi:MAG: hypothetical protein ACT4O6_04955 [Reyranella sp.]
MKTRKTSGWAFVVAFNVVAIAAILGVAELGARWMAGPTATYQDDQLPMCRPDAFTVWRYKPDVRLTYRTPEFETLIRTNDIGLRQGPIAADAADVTTVLFIGDSFTFGWGVNEDQRYSEVLARLMAEQRPDTRLRIVNAGHWMYTFDQQLVLMKEMIERYRPAVVVQGFYWMHVRTLFNHHLELDSAGALKAVTDPKIHVSDSGVLKFRSDWLERPPLGSQLAVLVARWLLNRDLRERAGETVDFMRPGSIKDEALWALTGEIVAETIRTLGAAGIAYVPFLVPTSVEVGGTSWANVGWTASTPPTGLDAGLPAARLATFFTRHGTTVVPLAAPMRERGGAALYFPQDGHWTAQGHAVAADILAPHVGRALADRKR